jgi:hypothetical protein
MSSATLPSRLRHFITYPPIAPYINWRLRFISDEIPGTNDLQFWDKMKEHEGRLMETYLRFATPLSQFSSD